MRWVHLALALGHAAALVPAASRAPRLWLGDAAEAPTAPVALSDAQHRHCRTVLRLKPGACVRVFGRRMGEWRAEIVASDRKATTIAVAERTRPAPAPRPPLELFFAPLRKKRASLLVEKAVRRPVSSS